MPSFSCVLEATEQMVLLFDKIVMGFIIHVWVGVLPAGETETTLQNNVKHYLWFGAKEFVGQWCVYDCILIP